MDKPLAWENPETIRTWSKFRESVLAVALMGAIALGAGLCPGSASANDEQPDLSQAAKLFRDGHYSMAREIFKDVVEREEIAGPVWTREHAIVLFNLGAACFAGGDLAEAALAFRRSLAVFEKLTERDGLDSALALEGLASVLLQQENLVEAQACIDRALTIRSAHYPENHPQLARLYALAANAAQLSGDPEKTEELYYKALMAYRRIHGNIHPTVAEIIQNIGTFYTDNGNFQAEIMFRQAADVGNMLYGPWHPLQAMSLTNFGRLRWVEGRYAEAEEFLQAALAIHDQLGITSHPELAVCLYQLGRVLLAQDRYAEAVEALERAASVYESVWWRAGYGAERSLALMSPYPLLALANLNLSRGEEALQAVNSHQGRLAYLAGRLSDLPLILAARRDSLVRELGVREDKLALLEAQLGEAEKSGSSTTELLRQDRAMARSGLAEVERRWWSFQTEASSGLSSGILVSSEDIRVALSPGEVAVGWLSAEPRPDEFRSWAFVVEPQLGLSWENLNDSEPRLGDSPHELVASALAEIASGSETPGSSHHWLKALAVVPLERHLQDTDRLVVMASSFLAGYPVDLLLDGDQEVVYSHFMQLAGKDSSAKGPGLADAHVLVVADPPFSDGPIDPVTLGEISRSLPEPSVLRGALAGSRQAIATLPPLFGTRQEAEALSDLFPETTSLLGPEANESNLRKMAVDQSLLQFDIIHLATHALMDAERPSRSALVLSQLGHNEQSGSDGLLTVREIGRTWRLDAELVTLSACATGLGRRIDGEGFLGFTQSLLGVGARNILVSLWPVDDRATALFMERFYGNMAGPAGMAPAQALQEARIWLRDYTTPKGTRPFAAPRFWAGFVMFSRLG